jgi:hypothetical protein
MVTPPPPRLNALSAISRRAAARRAAGTVMNAWTSGAWTLLFEILR